MNKAILLIEASGGISSVAIYYNGEIVEYKVYDKEINKAASVLAPMVDELLSNFAKKIKRENSKIIDAIAVSSGPGSYTGLRIVSSLAKGLCLGYSIPLISIPTLELIANTAIGKYPNLDENTIIRPMIDARRMEVYTASFDSKANRLSKDIAEVLEEENYKNIDRKILAVSNGAIKLSDWKNENIIIDAEIMPLAKNMGKLAMEKFEAKNFEDIAYFEPNYLKEYVAVIAKNKVLNK